MPEILIEARIRIAYNSNAGESAADIGADLHRNIMAAAGRGLLTDGIEADPTQYNVQVDQLLNDETLLVNDGGIGWCARLVRPGDTYGLDFCKTHESEEGECMVEFYDTRFEHTRFGQFVSRYYAGTLMQRSDGDENGLQLEGGVAEWKISGKALDEVRGWVKTRLEEGRKAIEL